MFDQRIKEDYFLSLKVQKIFEELANRVFFTTLASIRPRGKTEYKNAVKK